MLKLSLDDVSRKPACVPKTKPASSFTLCRRFIAVSVACAFAYYLCYANNAALATSRADPSFPFNFSLLKPVASAN